MLKHQDQSNLGHKNVSLDHDSKVFSVTAGKAGQQGFRTVGFIVRRREGMVNARPVLLSLLPFVCQGNQSCLLSQEDYSSLTV